MLDCLKSAWELGTILMAMIVDVVDDDDDFDDGVAAAAAT